MPETASLILACDRLQRHHALLGDGGIDLARDLDAVALPRRDQQLGAPGFDREQPMVGGKPLRAARRPPRSRPACRCAAAARHWRRNETGLALAAVVIISSSSVSIRRALRPESRCWPDTSADNALSGKRRDGRRAHSRRATPPAARTRRRAGRCGRAPRPACAVAAIDRVAIRHGSAVEHARQLLHPLRHAEIADAELANRMLDVGEERVGQILGDLARARRPRRAAGAAPGTCAAPPSRSGRAACRERPSRHKAPAAARPPRFARRGHP